MTGIVAITTARFVLYGKSLPRIEDALRIGEALRAATMGRAKRLLGPDGCPPCFPGMTWASTTVTRIPSGRALRPLQFHRFRRKSGLVQPDTLGRLLELRFTEPVRGPIALGFACHFGLGLLVPCRK